MRLKASFTIESSYVMAAILFGLASAILFAHRERSQIIAEYVVHQAAEEGSHLEEIYEKKGVNREGIQARASQYFGMVDQLSETSLGIDNGLFKVKVNGNGREHQVYIEQKKYNPENFMRALTFVEVIADGAKNQLREKNANETGVHTTKKRLE